MSLDLNNLDPVCLKCIKAYKKKHPDQRIFEIKCSGIPREYGSDYKNILLPTGTHQLAETAASILDPVEWASKTLDWHCIDPVGVIWKQKTEDGKLPDDCMPFDANDPHLVWRALNGKSPFHRPYQALVLRCSSRRRILRWGRQLGKSVSLCVNALYKMATNTGFRVLVLAPYASQVELFFKKMKVMIDYSPLLKNSIKRYVQAPMWTMELWNGSRVIGFSCVAGTKLVTSRGLIPIEDIKNDDLVLAKDHNGTMVHMPVTYVHIPNYKKVFKVSLVSGQELTVSDDHPFWTQNKQWVKLKKLSPGDKVAISTNYYLGVAEPDPLAYLLGLLLGDGNWTHKTLVDGGPRFTSKNSEIQKSFEAVLCKLDIPFRAQIHAITGSKEYTIYKRYKPVGVSHTKWAARPITALVQLLYDFNLAGTTSKDKFIPLALFNRGPEWRCGLLKGLLETDGFLEVSGRAGFCSVSKELAYGVRDLFHSIGVASSIRRKEQAGKHIPISYGGKQREICCNYDLYEVNITNAIAVKKLLSVIDLTSKKNFEECFRAADARIKREDKRTIDGAQSIQFKRIQTIEYIGRRTTYDIAVGDGTNNFVAEGVLLHNTAGSRSAGNADSVRGQGADLLLFDEADYLNSGDIASALAVVTNNPNATIWMSSTPTGKREVFYTNCYNALWKELHFKAEANPNWGPDMERDMRDLCGASYLFEAEAEFGAQQAGVYQPKYVSAAKTGDYEYGQLVPTPGWIYCVGVDWNDVKAGTTICVLGFCPGDNKFYIVDRHVVSREGWQALTACHKVAEVNRKWRPSWIYVDEGFGAAQVEILRKFGYDARSDPNKGPMHPDARLAENVIPFQFGGTVEIRDPWNKMLIKKPAKPFLVETSMRRFEAINPETGESSIVFPRSDTILEGELLGYIIKRVTDSGKPVYEQGNSKFGDHNLDAMNLAIVAFKLQFSEFGKPRFETGIVILGNDIIPAIKDPITGKVLQEGIKAESIAKLANQLRPSKDRVEHWDQKRQSLFSSHNAIPGGNMNIAEKKLWDWPGWGSDKPPPQRKSNFFNRRRTLAAPKRSMC